MSLLILYQQIALLNLKVNDLPSISKFLKKYLSNTWWSSTTPKVGSHAKEFHQHLLYE
jgi:hypothetical protein